MLFCTGFVSMFLIGGINGTFSAAVPVDFAPPRHLLRRRPHPLRALRGQRVCGLRRPVLLVPEDLGPDAQRGPGEDSLLPHVRGHEPRVLPAALLGLEGMPRRVAYYAPQFEFINQVVTVSAMVLGFAQLLVFANLFYVWKFGKKVGNDPWNHEPNTRTFEWEIPSPPPHFNFEDLPTPQASAAH
jgi:cytochrome c oxidase subunit 1